MPGSHSHPPLCLTAAMIFNLSEHKNTTPRVVEMDMLSEKVYVGSPQKWWHNGIIRTYSHVVMKAVIPKQAIYNTVRCNMVALPQGMRRAS